MNEVLSTILKDTYSLSQLKLRLRILKSSLLKAFFGGENLSFSPEQLSWLKSLPTEFYHKFSKDNVYQIFTEIEKEISKLKTLSMYLTFKPDDATLTELGTYVRGNFGPNFVLDIKLNPTLIAGTALACNGVYRDYSLKAKLESKKAEILQEFKKFLR